MKKTIFFTVAMVMSMTSLADCYAPNCYGALGYDKKLNQSTTKIDYSTYAAVKEAVAKECPKCETVTFRNGCGAIVYSPSHNLVFSWYHDDGEDDNYIKNRALSECRSTLYDAQLKKFSGDKRRSNRRVAKADQGECVVVAHACTSRSFTTWTYY